MYLHLGQDTVVTLEEIIGIFDMDTTTVSKISKDYLAAAQRKGDVVNVSYELPKSFIVCRDARKKRKRTVYISQISSATLRKRTGYVEGLANISP